MSSTQAGVTTLHGNVGRVQQMESVLEILVKAPLLRVSDSPVSKQTRDTDFIKLNANNVACRVVPLGQNLHSPPVCSPLSSKQVPSFLLFCFAVFLILRGKRSDSFIELQWEVPA